MSRCNNMSLGRVDFGVAKGINERSTIQFNRDADWRDNERVMRHRASDHRKHGQMKR